MVRAMTQEEFRHCLLWGWMINEFHMQGHTNVIADFAKQKNISDYKGYAREDRRFHNFVIDVGAKEFLKSILLTTNIISFSYQVLHSEGLVRPPNETIQEHLAVIAAIKVRDSEAAEDLMRRHFKKSLAYLKREINGEKKSNAKTPVAKNNVA